MFNRTKINFFNKWWISIDKTVLFLVILTILLGNVFTSLVSPVVANRIGAISNIFIIKNLIFSCVGIFLVLFFSTLNRKIIIKLSFIMFCVMILLMILVLMISISNKGAKRWIYILGFSLQPSEIIKPFFIVTTSYILTTFKKKDNLNIIVSLILFSILSILLLLQPDIGMLILMSIIFFTELFLIGVNLKYFVLLGSACIIATTILYFLFPHFHTRINTFLNSTFFGGEKSYQVEKSLLAFSSGGLLGKGPFEGTIKNYIPDAHTDFIFSVISEEFGGIVCICILFIFFYISIRIILKTTSMNNTFDYIAIISLSLQFLLQAIINIGVTINVLPTKGMTLPLISYGGSSMIGTSITMGFLLALSKKTYGNINNNFMNLIEKKLS